MILHETIMNFAANSNRSRRRNLVCSWSRCMRIEIMCVSTFKNEYENDLKDFRHSFKTFVLQHRQLVINARSFRFERMSHRWDVDHDRAYHKNVHHSFFIECCFSCESENFDQSHWLFYHFFLNFANVWFSFRLCVDLQSQNSNIRFQFYHIVDNVDNDCHVELLWISRKLYQLIFDRNKDELVSIRSFFAKFVHFLESSTVFLRTLIVCQYVDIICVFEKSLVDVESVAHSNRFAL